MSDRKQVSRKKKTGSNSSNPSLAPNIPSLATPSHSLGVESHQTTPQTVQPEASQKQELTVEQQENQENISLKESAFDGTNYLQGVSFTPRHSVQSQSIDFFAEIPTKSIQRQELDSEKEEHQENSEVIQTKLDVSEPGSKQEGVSIWNQAFQIQRSEDSKLDSPIESFNYLEKASIFRPQETVQRQELEEEKEEQELDDGVIQAKFSESEREEQEQQEGEFVQAKLTVGEPGDKYEKEADATAAKVMAMSDATLQRQTEEETEEIQPQENPNLNPASINRTEEEEIQTKAKGNHIQASSSLESRLGNSKGGGNPLSDNVRAFMEPRFRSDFSNVRVHTDSSAVQMNKELSAQAFTHGNDIYYGAGKSPGNNELTAHELTHTIQQTGGIGFKKLPEAKQIGEAESKVASNQANKEQSQSPEKKAPKEPPKEKQIGDISSTANSNEQKSETPGDKAQTEALKAKQVAPDSQEVKPKQKQDAQNDEEVNKYPGENAPQSPTEATTEAAATNVTPAPTTAGGNDRVGIDGGQEIVPVPQEAVPISAQNPAQILEQLKNTPPTQAAATYTQAETASAEALENQRQQLQETIPEIPAPTGLPAKESELQKASEKIAEQAAITKQAPNDKLGATTSGGEKAKYETSVPEVPPASPITATQLAGGKVGQEGKSDQALSRSAQNALANVSLNTRKIKTNAGDAPSVDLTGEADPSQINVAQAQSAQEVQAAKAKAAQGINQDFGENSIFPKASNETLKANKELSAVAAPGGKGGENPALPGEVVGGLNQSLSPFLREKIGVEQEKYQSGKDKFDTDCTNARTDADKEIGQLTEETKQKQLEKQQLAQAKVAQAKQEWQTELDNAELDYQQKAGKATQEQQQKIGQEKTKGETQAAKHLAEAEQKAEAEKQKADKEAAKKKEEGEKESGGFWGWAKSAAKTLIDGVKQAVNFVYDNLRKAVKAIFEAAKQLAMAAIDLARNAIVGLIKAFGEILKGLVRVVFAAFPGIAKKITAKIDQAVNKAEQAVNAAADLLKKGISAILDFLANTLDAILAAYQAIYNAILDAVGAVIDALFDVMQKIGNLVSAAQQMPDHFWGQMSEEVLGMDVTQPLLFERTPEDCTQCNAPANTEATPLATEGDNSELAQMLSKDEFTEDDIAVDGVAPFDVSPEFLASLNLQDGGEVEFGESNNPANSMEAIKAELGGEANPEQAAATPQTVSGGETVQAEACCDDEATAQAKLEQMMSQKVEGAENTQKQGQPAKQGDIPANMRTIGPLTPGQRASYMFNQLKQGIQQWFTANWGKLLAGAIAGITGFIALNILTGGAVMAAVPPLLQILGTVMAGVAMAQIAGHIGSYATKGWGGDIAGAAKSLARGVAVGAIELVFALLFNAGAIFKALKGGIKGAAKAAVNSVKTTVKATAKSAKELAKIGAKGAKTAFKNGKIMLKGFKGGFAKGAKSIDDLAKQISKKLKFNKFKISRKGYLLQLLGHINPWVLLANGDIRDIDSSNYKAAKGKKVGDIVDLGEDGKGIIIGQHGSADAPTRNISEFVQGLKNSPEEAATAYQKLMNARKTITVGRTKEIISEVGPGGLLEMVEKLGVTKVSGLAKKMGGSKLGSVIRENGSDAVASMLKNYDEIAGLPGAQRLMDDFISGGTTAKGAIGEIQYAAQLHRNGVPIKQLGDVVGTQKAADIVLSNGKIIDVKNINWNSSFYKRSGKLRQSNVQMTIDDMLQQVARRRGEYPGAPIRYAFIGSLDNVPARLKQALQNANVEIVGVF
ncbi:DUF4157 domain-containing protein [Calothrix rhizosoleniae]|uniref:eCIS core domain-containing protein n=1 Tax=Calothrix rhizosoleniae TaxID=888997 RepID=UPI00190F06A0|nr:DUF4157 domain-containing protein [Calothrix rhizosoleniae]